MSKVYSSEGCADAMVADGEREASLEPRPSIDIYSAFESPDHPGWYTMECAPIGLRVDLTDGVVTCHHCRLQDGVWFGAEHINPTHWKLSDRPTSS